MAIRAKQLPLVNTVNVKSVNGVSLLGSGDLLISGSAGALDDLTDVTITTPSTGQSLSYNGTVWVNSTPATGVTDHGLLTGLGDDDHAQYLTSPRGDARYLQLSGGTLSGALTLPGEGLAPNNAVTKTQLDEKAPLASPALTGTPTAPTATAGTNTTQVATTAFTLANSVNSLAELGITATEVELNYVVGVTSAIQTQLGGKVPTTGATTCSFTAGTSGTGIDWSSNIKQERTVAANTTFTFTATPGRASLNLFLGISSISTITWPINVVWATGTVQPSAIGKYNVAFYYNGTNYYGAVVAF